MTISPAIDNQSLADLLVLALTRASEVSQGKLTNFESSSPVSAILEAVSVVAVEQQAKMNAVANNIEANRLAVFGIEKQPGSKSVGTLRVALDGLYGSPFVLPTGFKLTLNGVQFETTADLTIPAYTASGTVTVAATTPGSFGNVSASAIASYQDVYKLASIKLLDDAKGGLDQESDAQWQQRIYATIRRRDTLLSEADFQEETRSTLGLGSVALAIGRLKPDKTTYANGYVSVFALNPDGSVLTVAQIASLQANLSAKAAMATVTLWSLDIVPVTVSAVVGYLGGFSPDAIASQINDVIQSYLLPGSLPAGQSILNKAIERRIQSVRGTTEGVVSVELNGLAAPAALPSRWSVAKAGAITIALVSADGQQSTYSY